MVKKIKKRKSQKKMQLPVEAFEKKIAELHEGRMQELDTSFQEAVQSITDGFSKYSIQDIATALFVSSLWLPNIASGVKHQFLLSILASIEPESFSKDNKIESYADFESFLKQIYPLLPTFFMLEDYIPEPDWGQVKFFHGGQIYKMFYGQELSNVYDYLILYQMLYVHLDEEYRKVSGRSPDLELQSCLRLQNEIISSLTSQATADALSELSPGHIEIPSKAFWENAVEFYSGFRPERHVDEHFLRNFSIELGKWPREYLNSNTFQEMVHCGKVVPKLFVHYEDRYLPVLPRRSSSILFDSWAITYERYHAQVSETGMRYPMAIGAELFRYIKDRVNCSFLRPLVSAVHPGGSPHDMLFHASFISKDRLILLHVTNPAYSRGQIEKELEDSTPKLREAVDLISSSPVTLALHLERANVQFGAKANGELKPELFVVVPQVSTEMFSFSIPKDLPGHIISMDQLLGIIDELDECDTFTSFVEYREENDQRIQSVFVSPLDIYGSFKNSLGTLVEGALDYDFISLDPHWGSNLRYETLSKFWEIYPEKHFFDHPRSWRVKKETETRVRLEARGYFGAALYCRVGRTHIYLNAPFDSLTYKQGLLANLLMECLEDSLSTNRTTLEKHQFVKDYDQLQILFFPYSLVEGNEKFKHLKHLNPQEGYWCSDYGLPVDSLFGIRLVFNDKLLAQAFEEVKDRSIEVALLCEVLTQLNEIAPDLDMKSIREALELQIPNKPRFKLFAAHKKASFPEFINSYKPSMSHFKRAKKRIAELAKQCGMEEGYYKVEDAKVKLNALRDAVIAEINTEVTNYEFANSIPYLLARVDALIDDYERRTLAIEFSKEHEVEYDRAEAYAERHSKYVTMHRNYRYLIEKFVQLKPNGEASLSKDAFQYLIAIIDWLHVFYSASDSLHYGIDPVGMKVDRSFLVDVEYESDMKGKERLFGEEEANISLGLIGRVEDRVFSPRPTQELMDSLDYAFKAEFNFTFRSMINVLQVLASWVEHGSGIEMSPSYSAGHSEIQEACMQRIEGILREEITPILKFFTLKKEDVLRISGQDDPCLDLPVWEHRKRLARYTLRPLILIEDRYYWGPYSAMKSGIIWSGNLSYGTLPVDLQSPEVQAVVESEKDLIENAIEEKAFDIANRYTKYARKKCELYNINPTHPIELGDYDVLAFIPEKNAILNVECKDILPPHCLKDAKRLREKIFGRPGKDQGHFEQIEKRQNYLSSHALSITKDLSWPVSADTPPKIITIYLTRLTYWWTRFPPREVNALFLRVDMLAKYIEEL
ncbi:MAG TPA: hypothetical protein VN328_10810 [Thermodesulfovibrionales bacterium]|nr:hypothetical protein [Thermodesulfovibrionales bacterium]